MVKGLRDCGGSNRCFRGLKWAEAGWEGTTRGQGLWAAVWRDKTRGSQVSFPLNVCRWDT